MHDATVRRHAHEHATAVDEAAERRTLRVVALTAVVMVVEVVAGHVTGSMALLADGWHMGTHACALGLAAGAYIMARRHAGSAVFSFGTGKFGILAGYTSALLLGVAAVAMVVESVQRLVRPVTVDFGDAIVVAVLGLLVNLVSIVMLGGTHAHGHGDHDHGHHDHHDHGHHDHGHHDHHDHHDHGHHDHDHGSPERQDHNYRAAYLHVLADALTSVLAIAALLAGRYLGWVVLDPVMGLVGGALILRWSYDLVRGTAVILLDGGVSLKVVEAIRSAVEGDGESRVADLHVWRLGSNDMAAVVSVVSGCGRTPQEYRARLADIEGLTHPSVEVLPCEDATCCALPRGGTPEP